MKNILCIILAFIHLSLYSQDLQRKKKSDLFNQETYFINKKDKKKNGPYLLQNISGNDTLVSGQYRNDSLCGIWSYYSEANQLFLKYNHDSHQLLFESEKIEKVDSFYIQSNGKFKYDEVDSPPVFIGYNNEIRIALARSIKTPVYILEKGQSCVSIYSIEIGSDGEITKYITEQSSDKGIDEQILQILKNYNSKWIPAKKAGEPVVSKIFLIVRILPQQIASQGTKEVLLEKPYIWKVDIQYFGVTRTTRLSSPGTFSGSGGFRTR
jgi:hypothetical protein